MALLPENVAAGTAGHLNHTNQIHKKLNSLVYGAKADFGAVGDGVADDTTPIQNAITAAVAAKAKVYLPPGTYKLTSSLTVTAGTGFGLIGAGWGTILTPAASMNDWAIKFDSTSGSIMGAVLANFKVDHNGANQTAGGCIYAKGAVQCLFDQLWLTRPYDAALWFNEISSGVIGHHNRVRACLFDNGSVSASHGQGIRLQSSDENTVEACDFESMGGAGSEPYAIKDWSGIQVLAHNVVVGGKEGFRLQDVASTRVIGNTFDGVGRAGVHASGSKNVIMGNLFSDASSESAGAYAQCQIDNSTSAAIVGNSFTVNTSSTVRNCVRELSSSSSKTLVADNIIDVSGSLFSTNKAVELLGTGSKAANNLGYATAASGTATVASGATTASVTHGLAATPAAKDILLTPTNSLGSAAKFWVSSPGATTFTINVNTDPGATTATFAWTAQIL